MRPLNAAQRYKLTSSLFLLTAFGAVFTVAAPSVFPCPAFEHRRAGLAHADDGWKWDGLARRSRPRRQAVIRKREERKAEEMKEMKEGRDG
jgi:Cytochrome C oxidase assembly factor 2